MNREFKFRVWDKKCEKFVDDFCIYRGNPVDVYTTVGDGWCCVEMATCSCGSGVYFEDSWIIQQFTGFLDVNNVEIYEGDIVEFKKWEDALHSYDTEYNLFKESVKYVNGAFWPRPYDHNCEDSYYNYKLYDFRVLGNIFENPELLK